MDKETIKVLFDLDADGYIIGWQVGFWDGTAWQAPFDTTGAVDLAPAALATVIIGATRYTDGQLVIDEAKRAELANPAPNPTVEQKMLAALALKLAKLEAG
ncbi:phage infection protein [Lacticaseibacillus kribbianus]|uniref:phage infection protein n=1 Tax=Lacticaseibacillus kribbianus TaxID=2926292 RepID=UPI001CD7197B|nr:phage infection protein [Lacticaseibacillus kribbianus]